MTIAIRSILHRSKVKKSISIKVIASYKRYRSNVIMRIKPAVLHNKSKTDILLYNPNNRGDLYIAYNIHMRFILKIGVSRTGYRERFKTLYTTGVPDEFQPVMVFTFDDATYVEKILHKEFLDYRVNMGREFFGFIPDMNDDWNKTKEQIENLKQLVCKKFCQLVPKYEGHVVVNQQNKPLASFQPLRIKSRKTREPKKTQKPRKTRQPKKIRENPRT